MLRRNDFNARETHNSLLQIAAAASAILRDGIVIEESQSVDVAGMKKLVVC